MWPSPASTFNLLDIAALVVLVALTSVLEFTGLVAPRQQGLFCDDASIRAPLLPETVDTLGLVVVTFALPLVLITLVEFTSHYWFWWRGGSADKEGDVWFTSLAHPWQPAKQLLLKLFNFAGFYFVGFVCTMLLTAALKLSVGRLRPNFLAVCQMDWSLTPCSNGTANYMPPPLPCANPSRSALHQASLSFPSGHASLSTYWMITSILYMEWRVCGLYRRSLFVLLAHVAVLFVGLGTIASRVTDFHHRWSDVAAGMVVGALTTGVTLLFAIDFYKRHLVVATAAQQPPLQSDTVRKRGSVYCVASNEVELESVAPAAASNGHCLSLTHSSSQVPFLQDTDDDLTSNTTAS